MPNKPKDKISLFVTRKCKVRAKVEPLDGSPPFEVTVGGQNWCHGMRRLTPEIRRRIEQKCREMHSALIRNCRYFTEPGVPATSE